MAQQIEAEAWTTQAGLQTEATTDVGGGLNVGYIDVNDWSEYTNKPLAAGNWTVQARMATWLTNRTIQVLVDGAVKTTLTCAASTGGYQVWTTVTSAQFNVATGGNHTIRLVFPTNSQNLNWIKFVSAADVTPPSTPTGLNSPAKTTTTVNLAWTASTDNVGVTGYEVYRGGALLASLGNVTAYQATGLTANTAYSFQVRAKDAAGNPSALSTALAVSTSALDAQAPSVPAGLVSPSQTNTTINLTWSASTDNVGVTGYDIYRGGVLIASVLNNVTTYQATGLTAGTAYSFQVRAKDNAGNVSALSTALSVSTVAAPATALKIEAEAWTTQLGLQTEATTDIGGGLNVGYIGANDWAEYLNQPLAAGTWTLEARMATWLTNRSIQLYVDDVLRLTLTYGPSTGGYQVWATATSGNFTLATGGNHKVKLVFPGDSMNLNWFRLVPVVVDGIAPTVPTGIASTAQTNTSINLTWTASTDNVAVTGYDVYQGGVLLAAVGNVTAYQATGLTANTAYSYQVRAKDAAGNVSALSTALAVSTTNVVANNLLVNGDFANGLTNWRATGGTLLNVPGEYAVNVVAVGNPWDANLSYVLPMTAGTTYTLTFKARSNGNRIMTVGWGLDVTPYTAQVQDITLTSAWTDYVISGVSTVPTLAASRVLFDMGAQLGEVHIDNVVLTGITVPDGQAPTVPTALASPAKTDATIDLTWTASTDNVAVTGYELYVNGTLKTTVGAVTTAQIMGLTPATAYAITLLAKDAAGNKSAQTAAINVTTLAAQTALTIEAESWTTMLGLQTEATTDVGGGLNVGFIDPGDWAEYTNKSLSAGTYRFEARIATMDVNRSVQLWVDGVLKTTLTYPTNTAGWQNWATAVSGDFIIATGGNHTIKLVFPVNSMNINWIKILPSAPDIQAPTTPTGLLTGVRTGTSIAFSWTAAVDNVGVVAHEIHLGGTYYFTSGATNQAKVSGLEPNTAYSLAVIAKDAAGNKSQVSGSLSASTNATYTNPNCAAGDAPAVAATKQQWWAGVAMNEPLDLVQEPVGNSDAWLLVEKAGRVLRLTNAVNGTASTFFTKSGLYLPAGGETGMAGLAFDPNYAANRFVYYTYSTSTKLRLARATANASGLTADLATEKVLLDFDYTSIMHRSGDIKFGPGPNGEIYLYMSTGDGGHWDINQDNQRWKANDNNQPNGKILRLSPAQYRGNTTLAWSSAMMVAKGLRNPWRMNFNGNDLYVGVVSGDPGIEELNKLNVLTQVGTHFGWPFGEGTDYCTGPNATTCNTLGFPGAAALTSPVMQYSRTENGTNGAAIIGGMFYAGSQFLANQGKYVYADYTLQQLRLWDPATGQRSFLIAAAGAIADIGVDRSGELMLVQHNGPGSVYKVVPGTGGGANWPPQNLADWGCFDNLNNGAPIPAEGVRYFDVAQRFWSDNAHKERFVAIPAGSKIDVSNTEDWKLPNGGVTIKNFYMDNSIFETRFFVRHNNGAYAGYTYRWDAPNAATLVPADGGTKNLGSMVWEYPSRAQCMMCHTTPVNGNVALETRQVNVGGQVDKFTLLNMLNPASPTLVPKFPDPLDVSVDVNDRAQSYLHVNCATCHRGAGNSVAGRATWDARYLTPLGLKSVCNKLPFEAVSGSANERIIKAGDHSLSTVWLRAHQRTAMYMPPLGSKIPDADGVTMLKDWITGLTTTSCPE